MAREQGFKRILVPTDSSPSSIIAEELTTSLAKKFEARATLLHVVTHELMKLELRKFLTEKHQHVPVGVYQEAPAYLHTEPSPAKLPEAIVAEISETYQQRGEEALSEAAITFGKEGIPVDKKMVHNADPAEAIIKEAKDGAYDLIVMEQSREDTPFLRGVAEKVSRHAETPVLIAKEEGEISKLLVPLDGSANSIKALQHAVMLAKKTDAKMTLLHVQEESLFRHKPEISKQLGVGILTLASEQVKGVKADKELKSGDPAKVIVDVAEKGKYDIIVMGSKGHGTVGRFLLGSVSDHVIHYSNRSVLLVR